MPRSRPTASGRARHRPQLRGRFRAAISDTTDGPVAPSNDRSLLLAALGDHEQTITSWIAWMPLFAVHRQSPAFRANVVASGRLRYWQDHGFPTQCRALGAKDFTCD